MLKLHRGEEAATVAAGAVLMFTPFLFGVAAYTVADAVAIGGGLILIVIGLWDVLHPLDRVGESLEGILGVLLLVSPWAFDSAQLPHMALAAWLIGLFTVLLTVFLLRSQPEGLLSSRQQVERERSHQPATQRLSAQATSLLGSQRMRDAQQR